METLSNRLQVDLCRCWAAQTTVELLHVEIGMCHLWLKSDEMSRHGCTSLSLEHEDVVKITSIKHCIGETGRQSPIITIHFFSLITLQDTAQLTQKSSTAHQLTHQGASRSASHRIWCAVSQVSVTSMARNTVTTKQGWKLKIEEISISQSYWSNQTFLFYLFKGCSDLWY